MGTVMLDYNAIYDEHVCIICSRRCLGRRSLGNHLAKSHGRKIYDYILEFYLDGVHPKCACDCGEDVVWHNTHYRFNEFVNGHNSRRDGFTSERQPTFTDEQLAKRSAAIRAAYENRGDEIRGKISEGMKQVWSDPDKIAALRAAQSEGWKKPEAKQHQSLAQQRAWSGEAGQRRREKVFTPEFGRKIAHANMRRDIQRRSKKEVEFCTHLRDVLGLRVVESYWYNDEACTKCYDAFLPDHNLLVELDGTYWHGLDRSSNWTIDQLHNMANDMAKNRIACERGLELIRIAEDVDLTGVTGIDGLRHAAYHHQLADGTIVRQGTFVFSDEKHAIVSREELIRINEPQFGGAGRTYTEDVILPTLVEFFREHALCYGWFYPPAQPIVDALSAVERSIQGAPRDVVSSTNGAGTGYLKAAFKSYWNVDRGPVEAFWDDNRFTKVMRYRLGLNNSKPYDYVLSDGTHVTCRETFDINIKNVRFGLIVQRNSVSFFKPHAAAVIYDRFLAGIERPTVWDPSSGFGARLLGFAAVCHGGKYIGTEPATMTYADLSTMKSDLGTIVDVELHRTGSESMTFAPCTLDFVFTSPPYFDKERYFDEPGQCWRDFPSLDTWVESYLRPTFAAAYVGLRDDRFMVMNVDEERRDVVVTTALDVGFELVDTLQLRTGRDHFNRSHGHTTCRTEPILVFVKRVNV